ncbi:secreted protein [Phakopsora pachyrhizi]|uniref:Secreted protein n=1 Tax=Phakopsora pachyrhizi TaxID=170000 RepID=A0AAV0B259_PHAPC|nr:secreted protein [Phakopsora pachyrhizi]KAI8444879.1 secreted protein [Phakopsora pachyrhizi]CAH7677464.1 secreted protein [Phakopsora pachyrhizi]CAH7681986.1 secreted protein [Phakopsora pachyrhizi]
MLYKMAQAKSRSVTLRIFKVLLLACGLARFITSQQSPPGTFSSPRAHSGCFTYYLASPTRQAIAGNGVQGIPPSVQTLPQPSQTTKNPGGPKGPSVFVKSESFFSEDSYQIYPEISTTNELRKRFETTTKIDFIASGTGICGPYDTENVVGVCLWSGIDPKSNEPSKMGWMTENSRINCGKRVFVQRAGRPETLIFAQVVDGCGFNMKEHRTACAQIYLTKKAFDAMKPTQEELKKGAISNLLWDFNTEENMVL